MHFSDQFLDEVVARNDIADVVSSYVTLTRKGGNLFGLCPFHNEKTPSFSVAPDKQIYHCFGCKKGGGVINFIMEIEGLSFPEAVEFLAKRANIPLPAEDEARSNADRLRRRVLELNRAAARCTTTSCSFPRVRRCRRIWTSGRYGAASRCASAWARRWTSGMRCSAP